MKRKGFVDTIPRPLPPMKFRTEIEEFCVRRGVITRQRLTSLRSLSLHLDYAAFGRAELDERVGGSIDLWQQG